MPPKRIQILEKGKSPIAAGATADCVFPEDIILSILTRLPVKSIIRFMSVCKPWLELLSTQDFKKMHRRQFSCDPKNQSLIIRDTIAPRSISVFEIESDEKKPMILADPHPETRFMYLIGCCNGLICMARKHFWPGKGKIVLWNPATKLFKFVKPIGNQNPKKMSLVFGYDAEEDDLKIVRIVGLENDRRDDGTVMDNEIQVYSVNSDSWTIIDPGFRFNVNATGNVATVNGDPYFRATVSEYESGNDYHTNFRALLRFDVRKMVMSRHRCRMGEIFVDALVDWKGSLAALIGNIKDYGVVESIDVWVFDEDDQLWSKNHTLGPMDQLNCGTFLKPSTNGKMLCLTKEGKMFVFDPLTGRVNKVYDTRALDSNVCPCLYTESLTHIKGMTSEMEKELAELD